jgi:hypothetical protein
MGIKKIWLKNKIRHTETSIKIKTSIKLSPKNKQRLMYLLASYSGIKINYRVE